MNAIIIFAAAAQEEATGNGLLTLLPIVLGAFLLVMAGMAVGVMLGRRPISGSCGGIGNVTNEDGETSCSLCQNPGEACKELKRRMEEGKEEQEAAVS